MRTMTSLVLALGALLPAPCLFAAEQGNTARERATDAASVTATATASVTRQQGQAPRACPDRERLFHAPVPLKDARGRAIITRRAVGHPAVCDWNRDGKPDLLLGCHQNMNTALAEIIMLQNVGSAREPRFAWPPAARVDLGTGTDKGERFALSCGCKSSGAFEIHPLDLNGDGYRDLVLNTHWGDGVVELINSRQLPPRPVFKRGRKLFAISGHGKNTGGGDWNQDGIPDLAFPVNAFGWEIHFGKKKEGGKGIVISTDAGLRSRDFSMRGHEAYPRVGKRKQASWFHRSPYAWNFSGAHGAGSGIVEVIAVMDAPQPRATPYSQRVCDINYYWLDLEQRTCACKGTMARSRAAVTRCAIGDLNGDGSMDLLWTGGVFTKGEDTRIWVMYGKVKNRP